MITENLALRRERELEDYQRSGRRPDRSLVLLLGPSATGKSTIIQYIKAQGSETGLNFEYVKPFTTRANRPGEVDKVSVDENEFNRLSPDFVAINALYGVRYGTPLSGITTPLDKGSIPIVDYPLHTVGDLIRPEFDLLNFYICPSSVNEWTNRVHAAQRNIGDRLEAGLRELTDLNANQFRHPYIDFTIVNTADNAESAAADILSVVQAVRDAAA